ERLPSSFSASSRPRFGRGESRRRGANRGTGRAKGAPCAVHAVRVAARKCARKYRRPPPTGSADGHGITPSRSPPERAERALRRRSMDGGGCRYPSASGTCCWHRGGHTETLNVTSFWRTCRLCRRLLRTPAQSVGSARGVLGGERW